MYINLKNSEELFYESNNSDEKFIFNPNFNFEDENYPQRKSKELLGKARKETDETIKLNLLQECFLYNNTNEEVILENLKLIKDEKEKKLFLKKYGYYLSESNFKKYFNKPKKGIIELFKELFNLFENYKNGYLSDINKIFVFVEEFCLIKPPNVFIDELNIKEELFFHFIFLTKQIAKLILSVKFKIYDKKLSLGEKLKKYFSTSEQQYINKLIEVSKKKQELVSCNFTDIENDILFINFKSFTQNFTSISLLIKSLKNEINFYLDNLNDSNLYIFICIQELILNLLKGHSNLKNKEFIQKIKNHTSNNNKDYNNIKKYIREYNSKSNNIKIEEDKDNINNLIFKNQIDLDFDIKFEETKILNNAYIYDWEKIINNDSLFMLNFNVPFEYQFLNFIKIEYINEFNFIKYTNGFIEELLMKISKSNTIISLLNEIYPNCEKIFNEKSDLISDLIKKVLSRCFYLSIFCDKLSCEFIQIKRIYFYLDYTHNGNLDPKNDFKKFLVVNLGIFIILFLREFFGRYLLNYLSILISNKQNIQFSKDKNKDEFENLIEIKLFNKRLDTFNLFQLIYILDIDNYKNNNKKFNMNFQNANKFNISENFYEMFKRYFGIEVIFNDNEKEEFLNLFGENNRKNKNNLEIITPNFNDCVTVDDFDFLEHLSFLKK